MPPPHTLAGRLLHHADEDPRRCAVAAPDGGLSFGELAERVVDLAERVRADGIDADSVVGIDLGGEVEHLVACLALAHLGATSFTLPTFESREQRERLLRQAGASCVLGAGGSVAPRERAGPADPLVRASPGATLLFATSGTTGEPKLVAHSDAGLVAQAARHVEREERFACLASIEHNFAKRHRLYCVAVGATSVFVGGSAQALPAELRALEATTLHLSAFQAQELLAAPGAAELRGLRLKLGGSHVPPELRRDLRERVTAELLCGYGTTETGAISFTDPDDAGADGTASVGRPLAGVEVRATDADGRELAAGETGELAVRAAGHFLGYLGDPRRTAERLVDGWFRTGDLGHLDEEGRVHVGGRTDDMFVFNSINVYPQELEARIREYPGVVDAAVLPKPSPVHGDVPVALVVLDDARAPDLRELKRFVRDRVGLRAPRQYLAVDRVPRNAAGKIQRDQARALLGPEGRA